MPSLDAGKTFDLVILLIGYYYLFVPKLNQVICIRYRSYNLNKVLRGMPLNLSLTLVTELRK